MKQHQSEKYTIAWFKIADYVSRGEKERALGMYRLLSHSIHDAALKIQLEGDILWSFGDPQALEKYEQTAEQYKKEGRHLEASAVYEHILLLNNNHPCREELLSLYKVMNNRRFISNHLLYLIHELLEKKEFQKVASLIETNAPFLCEQALFSAYEKLILAQAHAKITPTDEIKSHIKKIINPENSNTIDKQLYLYHSLQAIYNPYALYIADLLENLV